MKEIWKKNNITLLVLIVLIIAGMIILGISGFEKSPDLKAATKIEVYIPHGYEKQDIVSIAQQSFDENYLAFEEVEKLNQIVGIKVDDYTEEQLNDFKAKISEKYEINEEDLEIYEIPMPTVRVSTLVMPYVFPVTLVTVLSLIYILFRNLSSENKWKTVLKIVLTLAIVLGAYFSLILIFGLPFGNYTMPLALAIYIITLIVSVNNKKE